MHHIQQKILAFSDNINVNRDSYRQIGRLIGEEHPFKVAYHIGKLEKNKHIIIDNKSGTITRINKTNTANKSSLNAIPILGSANCGDATLVAEEKIEGYIKVSKKIIKLNKNMLAVKTVGNSMNKATVNNQKIENGDYVIVDTQKQFASNDIVLAIIDDCATVKRISIDAKNKIIALLPESTEKHPTTFLHENDKFLINGVVKHIIKKPAISWK